jgi:hypothetical protein
MRHWSSFFKSATTPFLPSLNDVSTTAMSAGMKININGTSSVGSDRNRGMARLSSGVKVRNRSRECRSIKVGLVFM